MKTKFVKCEFCNVEIPDVCQLATLRTVIDGKDYFFCCTKCAQQYREKKERKSK